MRRHLTAAVIAVATSGACLLAFGTGWWSVAFAVVVVCALVPVVWIVMLSLKTPATATDDKKKDDGKEDGKGG